MVIAGEYSRSCYSSPRFYSNKVGTSGLRCLSRQSSLCIVFSLWQFAHRHHKLLRLLLLALPSRWSISIWQTSSGTKPHISHFDRLTPNSTPNFLCRAQHLRSICCPRLLRPLLSLGEQQPSTIQTVSTIVALLLSLLLNQSRRTPPFSPTR